MPCLLATVPSKDAESTGGLPLITVFSMIIKVDNKT